MPHPRTSTPSHSHTGDANYRKTILDSGVRVITETIPYVRSVSIGIWADVGSRDETEQENGLSHFLEHMVFKGTKTRSVVDIAQSLESLGGYLNAFTTKEHTCFYARVLDAHVRQAMEVLSDLVLNATFKTEELEKEKLVVIEELNTAEDDPEDIVHDYLEKALFPGHSLGLPILGSEQNVRRFQREHLVQHLAEHYLPARLVVAAVGNLNHDEVVRLANRYLTRRGRQRSAVDDGGRQPLGRTAPVSGVTEYTRPIKQAHVCLGTMAYSIRHRNRYPLMVLNGLLGEGMSSRLYQVIRERHGFAYAVYSYATLFSDTGFLGVYIGTDRKNVRRALDLVDQEFDKLTRRSVSRAELDRTKAQIKGTLMLGMESTSSRMMRLGSTELYFGKYITLDSILKQVDAVTPEAVRQVAHDLFEAHRFSTVIIRPS